VEVQFDDFYKVSFAHVRNAAYLFLYSNQGRSGHQTDISETVISLCFQKFGMDFLATALLLDVSSGATDGVAGVRTAPLAS